jgi:hypothetical protein
MTDCPVLDIDSSTVQQIRGQSSYRRPMASTPSQHRPLAIAFASCSVMLLTLLANHPRGEEHGLAGIIEAESRNQLADGVVHGGVILVLTALIVSFVLLSQRLGPKRVTVVIGLTTFCVGCAALMASLFLDGLVVPAIASRVVGSTRGNSLDEAAPLILLCGVLIQYLLPLGLFFQAAAMLSWSAAILTRNGRRLAVGAFGLSGALLLMGALLVTLPRVPEHLIVSGLLLLSLWYLGLAAVLYDRNSPLS